MSSVPPSSKKDPEFGEYQIEDETIGNLNDHLFRDNTGKVVGYSQKVPKQNLLKVFKGFSHSISIKWGGFVDLIMEVFFKIFPNLRANKKSNESNEEENGIEITEPGLEQKASNEDFRVGSYKQTSAATEQIVTSQQKVHQKELKNNLEKVLKKWERIKNQSAVEWRQFLIEIENTNKLSNRDEELKQLTDLEEKIVSKILGNSEKRYLDLFDRIKRYPLDQDPSVLFNFYFNLEESIRNLNGFDAGGSSTLLTAKKKQLEQLINLQNQVKNEFSNRLNEISNQIESKLPMEKIDGLASELKISFPTNKKTFGSKIQHLDATFSKQAEEQQKLDDAATEKLEKLNLEEKELKEEEQSLLKQKQNLDKQRKEQLDVLPALLLKEINECEQWLKANENVQQTYKKFESASFLFPSERKEFESLKDKNIMQDFKDIQIRLSDLKAKFVNVPQKLKNETEEAGKKRVNDHYNTQISSLDDQLLKLKVNLEAIQSKKETLQKNLNDGIEKFLNLNRSKTKLQTISKVATISSEDVEKFIRLSFFQSTFSAFINTPNQTKPSEFIYKEWSDKQAFITEVTTSLVHMGVAVPNSNEFNKIINNLLVRKDNRAIAIELGILEFVES